MHAMRLTRAVVLGAVVALAATACTTTSSGSSSGGSSTSAASGSTAATGAAGPAVTAPATYKMGVGLPQTGAAAGYGAEYQEAINMGVAAANKQYAADGITITSVSADTQATAEGGANAANKLGAIEKTPIVLTAWGAVVAAMQPKAKDLGFALINAGAQSPALIGQQNVVNVLPMSDAEASTFAQYLVKQKGYKTFATIYVDNESGQGGSASFVAAVKKLGGTVVDTESIRQDATDASTQVAKVEAAKPDFVFVYTLLVEGAATFKAFKDTNIKAAIGTYNAEGEARLIRDAGAEKFNGVTYMSHLPKDVAGVKALLTQLKANLGGKTLVNQSYDAYFYAVPFMYAQVIKKLRSEGKPVTGDSVMAVLQTDKDITVPILGAMNLTDQLTYRTSPGVRQVVDYKVDPLDDQSITLDTPSS
ncbi:ABC-type branched-chain amino acid transport system, substrate-binding protein [Nakamurella panacisegetis]|uniref:ABC-type branched-chain amino acid transport system, substrate-binding protein n=1 Tax=Nakamurella panacisegetis TaxID=1090615 RepID=A0A1H0L9J5_9ACTN|nr:ABC transporter substrate-binding protein [Nakamurella panacisegetis]SDO64904.1 ABC-type branched-chain amino acid transport system, substrate-binding protein [Nakamurella panacisegetis]